MGIYTGEMLNQYNIDCEPADGYDEGDISAQVLMIENQENNLKLFEGTIMTDIQETAMNINGVNDYEIVAFTENVITDMLSKLKALFMKLWAKIKAIFRGFMARIDSVFIKNGKTLVNKYKSIILKKDMTDFEAKWRRPKNKLNNFSLDNIGPLVAKNLTMINFRTTWKSVLDKWDDDDVKEEFLKTTIGGKSFDLADYEKEAFDFCFEDEEVDDKIDINSDIMEDLVTHKDVKKLLERSNKDMNKWIKNIVKEFDRQQDEFIKARPGLDKTGNHWQGGSFSYKKVKAGKFSDGGSIEDDDNASDNALHSDTTTASLSSSKEDAENYGKALQVVVKYAHSYQDCISKYTSTVMKMVKFHNSQLRRVFAKAVAYNRKKNEEVMMEAFADLIEYEGDIVEEAGKSKKKKKPKGKKKIGDEVDDNGGMDVEESYNFLANVEFK